MTPLFAIRCRARRGESAGFEPWFDFVAAVLACWLEGNKDEEATDALWVCPEFGAMTSGYWLPSFPDPWQDAVFAKGEIARLWQRLFPLAASRL